ncbi:hypothetical protein [Chthonobacter rhizosphaerae]|uniref:hypothetical protein n=1 Tax=Chthonobacter rhizosphaerae TaxID=2735553 RepID=UPI0015EE8D92|nr:hypothetical protein [Chthonobacter rhizosphaerae]
MSSFDRPARDPDDAAPGAAWASPAVERGIVWGGIGLIALAAVATVVLNLMFGEAAFAARLMAGIAGCL